MELSAHGISADLPVGWEGRILRRVEDGPPPPAPGTSGVAATTVQERTFPVAHLANFALPENRGDFGSGAVDLMRSGDVLICLLEYGPECVGTALFSHQGLPRTLEPGQFNARGLQRTIAGQAGTQVWFTENDRAFCLYVVLGRHPEAPTLVPQVNGVLATTTIEPR